MSENSIPKEIKILLLGDTNVGKTAIFRRYIHNRYETIRGSSIGVDFEQKVMKYKNKIYSIIIFDTAGQERFRSIIKSYYRIGHGFFIVFDLTDEKSLDSVPEWIQEMKEMVESPNFIILGNKDDLAKEKIPDDIINKKIKDYNSVFIKTSAKANTNIKLAIEKMIDSIETDNMNKEKNKKEEDSSSNNSFHMDQTKYMLKKQNDEKIKCC